MISLVAGEPYSHVAIVVKSCGKVKVYDVDTNRKRALDFSSPEEFYLNSKTIKLIPFSKYLNDRDKKCVIRQVEWLYEKNPPYDYTFSPGEEKLYCVEFVENVFEKCHLIGKLERLENFYPELKIILEK